MALKGGPVPATAGNGSRFLIIKEVLCPAFPKPSRLMHGVASGSIKGSDVPKKVAKEYVAADKGKSQAKLPQRKAAPRGR